MLFYSNATDVLLIVVVLATYRYRFSGFLLYWMGAMHGLWPSFLKNKTRCVHWILSAAWHLPMRDRERSETQLFPKAMLFRVEKSSEGPEP